MAAQDNVVPPVLLADVLGPDRAGAYGKLAVEDLELDSRKLVAGGVFLAMPGVAADGRDFLAQARKAGVAAIVAEQGVNELQRAAAASVPVIEIQGLDQEAGRIAARFFHHPGNAMHLVGVTGTNGKTTTARLTAQLLRTETRTCGVIGTLGASLDNGVDDAVNTTPDAISLQRQLARWRDEGVACAALEVSSHSLVQGRVNGLGFNTAIFTNLSHDHLDYHGDMESYGLAKAALFLRPGLETAIINKDDGFSEVLMSRVAPSANVLTYSASGGAADVSVSAVQYRVDGLRARLHTPWGNIDVNCPLVGSFNLANLLAAVTAACVAGLDLDGVVECARELQGVAGRMQTVPNELGVQLVVDYAHTPAALEHALLALRAHTSGRLVCVFGCGGDRDAAKRPQMGEIATALADQLVVTSDNPRGEDPLEIIADIRRGCNAQVVVEPDRALAIQAAVALLEPGDVLLVAGKGHENYQLVGSQRLDFDDAVEIARAVARRVKL